MEVWQKYYSFEWHIPETSTGKLAKARGQQAGPTSPLLTLLGHQRLCFPNALTWHRAKPHAEPLRDQISLKMRLWDLSKILEVHCTPTGRAFSCKISNAIAISNSRSPHCFPLFLLRLAPFNWLLSLGPKLRKAFLHVLKTHRLQREISTRFSTLLNGVFKWM